MRCLQLNKFGNSLLYLWNDVDSKQSKNLLLFKSMTNLNVFILGDCLMDMCRPSQRSADDVCLVVGINDVKIK